LALEQIPAEQIPVEVVAVAALVELLVRTAAEQEDKDQEAGVEGPEAVGAFREVASAAEEQVQEQVLAVGHLLRVLLRFC